jgi:tetratricopeptide (TPR) repeat protein
VLFAWLFLPLLPVLNIALFSADDFAHDRYLYLPAIGLSLGIALTLKYSMGTGGGDWRNIAATAVAALVIAPLGVLTTQQSRSWRDSFSLFSHAVNHAPNNAVALNNLACVYMGSRHFQEAEVFFLRALTTRPTYWNANFSYASLNYQMNRYPLAESFILRAIKIRPYNPDQYLGLGMIYLNEQRLEEAASAFREAIARKPYGFTYHLALGLALEQQGHAKAAKEEFLKELAYHPENTAAREELATMDRDADGLRFK